MKTSVIFLKSFEFLKSVLSFLFFSLFFNVRCAFDLHSHIFNSTVTSYAPTTWTKLLFCAFLCCCTHVFCIALQKSTIQTSLFALWRLLLLLSGDLVPSYSKYKKVLHKWFVLCMNVSLTVNRLLQYCKVFNVLQPMWRTTWIKRSTTWRPSLCMTGPPTVRWETLLHSAMDSQWQRLICPARH